MSTALKEMEHSGIASSSVVYEYLMWIKINSWLQLIGRHFLVLIFFFSKAKKKNLFLFLVFVCR